MNKAFVSSFLAITAAMLLLEMMFSAEQFGRTERMEQDDVFAMKYAEYYFDDISYDLTTIAPDNPYMYRVDSTHIVIGFTRKKTNLTLAAAIGNYTEKLQPIARKLAINVSINASDISGDVITYYFSNGVVWRMNYANPPKAELVSSPATDFQNHTVYFRTNLTRKALQDFNYDPNGDFYARVDFRDANGTYQSEGFLDSGPDNVFHVTFGNDGQLNIHINEIDGNPKSLSVIRDSTVEPSYMQAEALMENNGTYEVYMILPVTLNITHLVYSKTGMITPLKV